MNNQHWAQEAIIYHIYPLGLCGAPHHNNFNEAPVPRLDQIHQWLGHIQSLGANTLYLGPLFESGTHGYDTSDYYHVDRRLGDWGTLANLSKEIHRRGMRLVLDGVFNHVGRDFWAFKDVLANHNHSQYVNWFLNLDFSKSSPFGDPFSYAGWSGHYDLVKLNLDNPAVRTHILGAVQAWQKEVQLDGLRLDAADQIEPSFLIELGETCRAFKPDFWLMGEMVFGDYNNLLRNAKLDSVTNYETYKALYSSHNDGNYYEIAYALNRQFGKAGIYKDKFLYSFADNHDVDRVASTLKDPRHLFLVYSLLFTIPGIPSIYFGSEWGLEGKRLPHSDTLLRPALDPSMAGVQIMPDLKDWIARLACLRRGSFTLQFGDYQELLVSSHQFAFARTTERQAIIIAANASSDPVSVDLTSPLPVCFARDIFYPEETLPITNSIIPKVIIAGSGVRILLVERQ